MYNLPHIDHYSLWLIFDDESTAACQKIIHKLAETHQSVSFTPHITLSSTPNWAEEKIRSAIDKIAKETQPLELKTTSVRCASNPYQKLTHGIQITDEFSGLHQKINTYFEGEFAENTYPHISYLYSRVNCNEISHEIDILKKDAPQKIVANRLVLVMCKGTPKDWRLLFKWELNNQNI